jgi:hypothetical protein
VNGVRAIAEAHYNEQFADVFEEILERARVFYTTPTGPYAVGDLWVDDYCLYQSTQTRESGFVEGDWIWCIRSNFIITLETTNGNIFKVGQTLNSTIIPHIFKNGVEVNSSLPDAAFRWRRVSQIPQDPPNDDATWNTNHAAGYRTLDVTAADVYARATYHFDLME